MISVVWWVLLPWIEFIMYVCVMDEMHVYMAWILALLHQKYDFCRSVTMNARSSELDLAQASMPRMNMLNARSSELDLTQASFCQ